jgi:hypothetical protein
MMSTKAETIAWLITRRDRAREQAVAYSNDADVAQANARTAEKDAAILDHMIEIVRLGDG